MWFSSELCLTDIFTDLPELVHESLIRPLFSKIYQPRMVDVLQHMTGYYNRYYGDIHGELSSEWLHEHIAEVFSS